MEQLYSGPGPMKVFWMFSGGTSSLRATFDDPNNGGLYTNVGAFCDKEKASGRESCNEHGIPHFHLSRKEFYSQKDLDPKHHESRERFYEMLTERIDREFSPDLICLSGYMHIVSDPLLGYRTMLNVHPADLSILAGPEGDRVDGSKLSPEFVAKFLAKHGYKRKFTGDDAVHDAVRAGEQTTRSTIHIVTDVVDGGPILVQSKPFHVGDGVRKKIDDAEWVADYAAVLQDVMKAEGDGPAYLKALEMTAQGLLGSEEVDIETPLGKRKLTKILYSSEELPYCGVRLE